MKRRLRGLAWKLTLLVSPAAATVAWAAGGGDEGASSDLPLRVLNFVILGAGLVYFARKPVREFFTARHSTIESQLAEAAALQEQAEQQHATLQSQLAELEREVEGIQEATRARAEREAEQILADAHAAADRIQRDAATAINRELRRGQVVLREEASQLAVSLAADLLREQVGPADRQRLLDEFIQSVEEAPVSTLPGGAS